MKSGHWFWIALFLWVMPVSAQQSTKLRVPHDYATIANALLAAPDHATVEIAPGEYAETILIERPVVLRAGAGDVVITGTDDQPVIEIADTYDVTIRGLTVQGGQYGIEVTRSLGVVIRNNTIRDNRLAGIKVRMGAAAILGNVITNTLPPYGKGIHITNTMDWPKSIVRGNTISGNAMSGITTNMSMVTISNNIVSDNGQRGIAITEMTEAVVADNVVESNTENGIYISDQSIAIVCNNTVSQSQLPTIEGQGRYGNGITVDYYSSAELHNNILVNNANYGISVLDESQIDVNSNIVRGNGSNDVWTDDSSAGMRNIDLPQSCE